MESKALILRPCHDLSDCRNHCKRFGHFRRRCDGAVIQRFRCHRCGRTFSDASFQPEFRQHKRHINHVLFRLLCGGYSLRRCAIDLQINRKTVVRKFLFLGELAFEIFNFLNQNYPKAHVVEFDDMETFEHTKCKPLSITLAVEGKKRRILGFEVSQMPAKGLLAKLSRKKYGFRKDERPLARNRLFETLKPLITENCLIKSDRNPHYTEDVRRHFPGHEHKTTKGRRGCVVGQGELKGGGWDPLFTLNHTCAMLRDNIKRLARRTWCTTKRPERLFCHIAIYALYHNEVLIKKRKSPQLPIPLITSIAS
jgi:hypothetical protein